MNPNHQHRNCGHQGCAPLFCRFTNAAPEVPVPARIGTSGDNAVATPSAHKVPTSQVAAPYSAQVKQAAEAVSYIDERSYS